MIPRSPFGDDVVRDGIESLPEMDDIQSELPATDETPADRLLDEGLIETFPASDALASGKFE